MSTRPALPFRMLRKGLQAASRASSTVVERMLRNEADGPLPEAGGRGRVKAPPPGTPVSLTVGGRRLTVDAGMTVLEAVRDHDLDLRYYCGGNCSCGTCRIEIRSGAERLSRAEPNETFTLGMDALRRGDRLACQARILGDVEIHIPPW